MITRYRTLLAGAAAVGLALTPALAAATELHAMLKGAEETGGGDSDGTGELKADVDADTGDFCFSLAAKQIASPVAAHIHEGAAGSDGPPVITISVTGTDSDECVAVEPDLLKAILANPAGYYANVHTGDYPKGAIRGQLTTAH
ncbi:CHRD domain-containing protein [Novosphingobium aquimarinum]|uniref:CHRD domain-containing protein n=1 Tax=Novosphingobium aquimarinum TaxID=2682494 RepID=UPI0012EBE04B|nr:CHRD domain-containing protein [Novosphingobium aquimarinum]